MKYNALFLSFFSLASAGLVSAQTTFCNTSAVPAILRAEGLAERVGDIQISCTGSPNATLTGNFTFSFNSSVTNRLGSGNTLTGIVFTGDSGSGPQPVLVQPVQLNQFTLVFNGATVTFSPQGTLNLRVAGIRVNATQTGTAITAFIAGLPIAMAPMVVGLAERGLYVGNSDSLICAQNGSPLPDAITFSSLLAGGTAFATTRVTEGFADAFGPRRDSNYFNADSGQRILVQYTGFPSDARLFVPDAVAGSDAVHPTAGGDLEVPGSGGAYQSVAGGSLLLARVAGANANGAGGTPVFAPSPIGSPTVNLDSVSEIPIVNGSAFVTYEVVDANPSALETAQFPTFLGLLPNGSRNASVTAESVYFAPLSTAATASTSEPLPRFTAVTPQPDCGIIGDCGTVQGQLSVGTTPINVTEPSGGATAQAYFTVRNLGGGLMPWTASISYAGISGWLVLDPKSSVGNTTVRVYSNPAGLAPGTYSATITINAGPAGSATVPVSFTVTAAPVTPKKVVPAVTDVLNSASLAAVPIVPGSLTTIKGSAFTGKTLTVTFNGIPATILFSNDTQINLLVPQALSSVSSADLVISVDGSSSTVKTVPVAPFEPAIFPNALLNQDGTLNSASNAAARGSVVYFWATGLSGTGHISVRIGDRQLDNLNYAGPAPGLLGVQQVNVPVPADLQPGAANLYVCASNDADGTTVCGVPVQVTLN